jgi:hypothetical protein
MQLPVYYRKILTYSLLLYLMFLTFGIRVQGVEHLPAGQFTENDAFFYQWMGIRLLNTVPFRHAICTAGFPSAETTLSCYRSILMPSPIRIKRWRGSSRHSHGIIFNSTRTYALCSFLGVTAFVVQFIVRSLGMSVKFFS